MPELNEWLAIVALFVVLPVLTWPETLGALARLAGRVNDWTAAHTAPTQERDDDEEDLWLTYRSGCLVPGTRSSQRPSKCSRSGGGPAVAEAIPRRPIGR